MTSQPWVETKESSWRLFIEEIDQTVGPCSKETWRGAEFAFLLQWLGGLSFSFEEKFFLNLISFSFKPFFGREKIKQKCYLASAFELFQFSFKLCIRTFIKVIYFLFGVTTSIVLVEKTEEIAQLFWQKCLKVILTT